MQNTMELRISKRLKRIQKEIDYLKSDIEKQIIQQIDILQINNTQQAIFAISGPINSPYEGYTFRIKVQWGEEYPMRPPNLTLMDKIWNPYIEFQTNKICMDIISRQYSPALTTQKLLLSFISLIGQYKIVNYTGFLNPEAASQMINNYSYFCQLVKGYCQKYCYQKKDLYLDSMRGIPEQHIIKAQGEALNLIVQMQSLSVQFQKRQDPKLKQKIIQNNQNSQVKQEAQNKKQPEGQQHQNIEQNLIQQVLKEISEEGNKEQKQEQIKEFEIQQIPQNQVQQKTEQKYLSKS